MSKLKPYQDLVEAGYLNSQTSGDLVLFNYTDLCTYEKHWNEYTLAARGLIFNHVTEEIVARPFPKFFNLSELENKELPQPPMNLKYEAYEKLDGSLGILYQDTDKSWKIATRGSFASPQALKATEMFNNNSVDGFITSAQHWPMFALSRDYTLLFEIIYPENRVSPGARLVTDYGSLETLVLIGAIEKTTGLDMSYEQLSKTAHTLGLPVCKKFDLTIPEMIEMKKTLPATEEGWVVRFENGYRCKIKGDEYLKFHRLINSINPLSIWQRMVDENSPTISDEFKKTIPEEILPELNEIEAKLKNKFAETQLTIGCDYIRFEEILSLVNKCADNPVNSKKVLGLFCQDPKFDVSHPSAMFLLHNDNMDAFYKYILKSIRPNANII